VIRGRLSQIGLDRLIRLNWLEKTTSLILAGNEAANIKAILLDDLRGAFQSNRTDVRGSLDKTITILMRVWLTVPVEIRTFRNDGLALLAHVPQPWHLAIHWGMVTAVYPFWSVVAGQVGRLLRLQGSAVAAHVQRRVSELYGERETVSRRARYILRSYVDWGVIKETGVMGVYTGGAEMPIEDSGLIAWLLEATLYTRVNGPSLLKDLIDAPSLFPFRFKTIRAEDLVASSSRLDTLRHGLDDDLIMLKRSPSEKVRV